MKNMNIPVKLAIQARQNIKESDYWKEKLSGPPGKSFFPYDIDRKTPEPANRPHTPAAQSFTFPPRLNTRIREIVSGSEVRLNMVLVTGIVILLEKYTGNKDIIVGTPVYKQEEEGEFINKVLILRNQIENGITFKKLLQQVRQTIIKAVEHQNYPLEAILYRLEIQALQGDDFPLFDTAIVLKNIHDPSYIKHIQINTIFSFSRTDRCLEGEIQYNGELYRQSTIKRIIDHFLRLMDQVLFNVEKPLADIEILSEAEKKQQLLEFNNTRAPYPAGKTIHCLFAEQVERTPDATALVGKVNLRKTHEKNCPMSHMSYTSYTSYTSISYKELHEKTQRLAKVLKAKGVVPDTIVGIMADRSIDTVVGILAILKAGGAYLPIDTETPGERLHTILEDAQAPLLLTTRELAKNKSLTAIPGRHQPGPHPLLTAIRPQITDFDSLPNPDRSLVNYEKYNRHIGLMMVKNSISIQASRGCPFRCAYCHQIWPKTHISRTPGNIFAEVRNLYNLGVRRFSFVDDIFNLNIKNSTRFLQLIIENGMKVQLFFGLRGDLLTREYIDLMVKAGAVRMAVALETASPRLQKLIRKNLDIEKLRENITTISEKYPQVILELHTIVGLVTETEEEAMMTLDFIKGIKWIHFNNLNILKIYPNTYMEQLARENGIPQRLIEQSKDLAYHELPETLPLSKNFIKKYQAEFLNDYFLLKERVMHVLPHQMKILTEDEILQKYNSYLPAEINSFDDLLQFLGIRRDEMENESSRSEEDFFVPRLNQKFKENFLSSEPGKDALNVMLLDLSQFFSTRAPMLYDVVEVPIGLMYLMTYLKQQYGSKINGKIAKSRMDFDNYQELKEILDQFKPEVIGIRTLTFYKDFFHETVGIIRQWGYEAPIIAGGPYATSDYNFILGDANVDLVVLGEGEVTFSELIGKIMENNRQMPAEEVLKEIPGIAFVPLASPGKKGRAREIITLESHEISDKNDTPPLSPGQPAHLAYVIYTSGSTGTPKGVMVEHGNVVNVVSWYSRQYHIEPGTNVLQLSDYTYDASVNQLFATLLHGGTLHVIPKEIMLDIEALRRYIRENRIHIVNTVPIMIDQLLGKEEKLGSLRAVISGGEQLDDTLKDKLLRKGYSLYNQYGPTETTIDALMEKCTREKVTLGKPIANVNCYMIGKNNRLAPPGTANELYVGGKGVARGYLNNPTLTRQKFKENPLRPGERVYRTGDLAKWQPQGNIQFLGREDQQVKIRGLRIELGEIENRLKTHPDIKDAVVVCREEKKGEKYICAYIVPAGITLPTGMREYLSRYLPTYMVPAQFVEMEKIPLTPGGKVDRRALPHPDTRGKNRYEAPADHLEEEMVQIWAAILQEEKDTLSVEANFFQLGGHSLKAVKLAAEINKRFKVKVPLSELFREPTVRGLSRFIREAEKEIFLSVTPVEKREYYPLSSAQKRLYFIQHMDSGGIAYNTPNAVTLAGEMDTEKLHRTFKLLIKRHGSLRTSFEIINDEPVQRIHDHTPFEPEYFNAGTHSGEARDRPGEIVEKFVRPFDLSNPLLMRVGLIKIEERKHILMLDMHHIITDSGSREILIREFMKCYKGETLPPINIQYPDYTHWRNSRELKRENQRQEAYWLDQLSGEIPQVNLPVDFPRPAVKSHEGDHIGFQITAPETRALESLAGENNTTLFTVLLAIYNVLLAKLTNQEDIVVGTAVAGRGHADLQQVVGLFINMLALRNYPTGDKTFNRFLKEVKQRLIQAFNNQDYPFENLVEKLSLKRNPGRNPLVDVGFAYQTRDTQELEIPGLKLSPYHCEYRISKFDMILIAVEPRETLHFTIEYSSKLFRQETIDDLIKDFKKIISAAAGNPGTRLKDIKIESHAAAINANVYKEDQSDFGY